jgi:hypothetical protein
LSQYINISIIKKNMISRMLLSWNLKQILSWNFFKSFDVFNSRSSCFWIHQFDQATFKFTKLIGSYYINPHLVLFKNWLYNLFFLRGHRSLKKTLWHWVGIQFCEKKLIGKCASKFILICFQSSYHYLNKILVLDWYLVLQKQIWSYYM